MIDRWPARLVGAAERPVSVVTHTPVGSGPHPALVICHGFKGFKDWGFFPWLADGLAEGGVAAVRFDFSHNGVGEGADSADFTRLDLFEQDRMSYRLQDLAVVHDALGRGDLPGSGCVDRERLAVFGHSLGGAVATLSLKERPFRALVTLAAVDRVAFEPAQRAILERDGRLLIPNARTGQEMPLGIAALHDIEADPTRFDLDAAAASHGRPWLILHGEDDPTVPVAAARRLAGLARDGTTRLRVFPGADHVLGARHPFTGPTPELQRALAEIQDFLSDNL